MKNKKDKTGERKEEKRERLIEESSSIEDSGEREDFQTREGPKSTDTLAYLLEDIDNLGNYVNITPKFSNNTFRNGGNTIHLKVYNENPEQSSDNNGFSNLMQDKGGGNRERRARGDSQITEASQTTDTLTYPLEINDENIAEQSSADDNKNIDNINVITDGLEVKNKNYSYLILTDGWDSNAFNKYSSNSFDPEKVKPTTSPVSVLRTVTPAASSPSLSTPNLTVMTIMDDYNYSDYINISEVYNIIDIIRLMQDRKGGVIFISLSLNTKNSIILYLKKDI